MTEKAFEHQPEHGPAQRLMAAAEIADHSGPEPYQKFDRDMKMKNKPSKPPITTPAPTTATTSPTIGAGGTQNCTNGAMVGSTATKLTNIATIADLDPTDAPAARANVVGLAVLRLVKAAIAAAVAAGMELTGIEREVGAGFPAFITTKTMLTVPEARTLIELAARAGLQPDRLTAAVDVPLGRVLEATALLGNLYLQHRDVREAAQPFHHCNAGVTHEGFTNEGPRTQDGHQQEATC